MKEAETGSDVWLNGVTKETVDAASTVDSHVHFRDETIQKHNIGSEEVGTAEENVDTDTEEILGVLSTDNEKERATVSINGVLKGDFVAEDPPSSERQEQPASEHGKSINNQKIKSAINKKVKARKIEQGEIHEWEKVDDFDDASDLLDEDLDDDIEADERSAAMDAEDPDGEIAFEKEGADRIDSWKMTEQPLDETESETFDREEGGKFQEQEDLQEEIKQLKGVSFLVVLTAQLTSCLIVSTNHVFSISVSDLERAIAGLAHFDRRCPPNHFGAANIGSY